MLTVDRWKRRVWGTLIGATASTDRIVLFLATAILLWVRNSRGRHDIGART